MTVIEPFVAYAPSRLDAVSRAGALERYRARVLSLAAAPTVAGLEPSEFEGLLRKRPNGER
jgi:NAD(P)H dehydrogenase (quinone)